MIINVRKYICNFWDEKLLHFRKSFEMLTFLRKSGRLGLGKKGSIIFSKKSSQVI